MIDQLAIQKAKDLLASGLPHTENEAREIAELVKQDVEVLTYLLLELARRLQASEEEPLSPATPSGMIPPYLKEPTPKRKKKKKSVGHPGASRPKPERIDRTVEHRLEVCPDCGGPLRRCGSSSSQRSRVIEDIPETLEPEVTEHLIHRDYCPACDKLVEPKIPSALRNATIGNRLLALTAYWHYSVGMTTAQILDTLNYHLQFKLSAGGLCKQWNQLSFILEEWDEAIGEEIRTSAVAHGDESSWRVNGRTHWLWCFTTPDATYYMIDPTRASPVVKEFFRDEFNGMLVTDFYAAYNVVSCMRHQCCLVHLLRELKKVSQHNPSDEWLAFAKKTQRLMGDALRLRALEDFTPERYESRIDRIYARSIDLALEEYRDEDAKRLAQRLLDYRDELFVFLSHPEVPSDNNHAEREIRPAVIMRKNQYGNRTEKGAKTQAILMSVFRTLKRRGHNPINTVVGALAEYIQSGKLPSLPANITSKE